MDEFDFLDELLKPAETDAVPAEPAPQVPEEALPPQAEAPEEPAAEAPAVQAPPTVRPQSVAARPVPQEPPAPPAKRRPRLGWLWFLLGLLLGIAIGFSAARLLPRLLPQLLQRPAAAAEQPKGDLTEHLQIADDEAIATAPAKVYEENVHSVVGITNEGTVTNIFGQLTPAASSGTGFILSEDGYILTNYHVVKGANTLTVTLYDGRTFPARLVGYEAGTCDAALLKIDAEGLPPVTLGNSDNLLIGEQVCAIGNPLGELTYTLTVGYISAKDRTINTDGSPLNMLQTDCTINSGNSGGPLFDMHGSVIGITTAKYSGSTGSGASVEGIGFAIPINDVIAILDDLQANGRVVGRAYLGVTVLTKLPSDGLPEGTYVQSVTEGYCAAKAGLQAGDVITAIDESEIRSYDDLVAVLGRLHAGDTVILKIWRDGETLELTLTLDERPPDTGAQSGQTDSYPFP